MSKNCLLDDGGVSDEEFIHWLQNTPQEEVDRVLLQAMREVDKEMERNAKWYEKHDKKYKSAT
jgi:hypothetical protein